MPRAPLAFLVLLLIASPALAQPRRVAILDFTNSAKDPAVEWLGAAAVEDVTTRLHAVRTLALVERSQLYRVLQQQKLNLSDLVDPAQAVTVGKLLGAEQVVLGGYTVFGGSVRFNVRFVDVATGAIVATSQAGGVIDPKNPDALWQVFERLAQATIDSLNTRVAIVQGTPQPAPVPPAQRIEPTPAERARLAKPGTRSFEAQEAHGRGLVAYRSHRWAEAAREFERATILDSGYAAAWSQLGWVLQSLARWPEALRAVESALRLHTDAGDESGQAGTLSTLGVVHEEQGRYADALGYYERSLRLAERLGDEWLQAKVLNNMGVVHKEQGRYADALGYYERSLRLKEKLGDEPGRSSTLNNIGSVHIAERRYAEALRYFEQNLRLDEKLGDEPGQAVTLGNIGVVHQNQGRYAEALRYYERSLRLAERVGDERRQAWVLNNVGMVHESQQRYGEALGHYERALVIGERFGLPSVDLYRRNRDNVRARIR